MLDTDQLRSFLAIVDSGSFTRAAEMVNKTQSAVSMHIRRLEERLDCRLFTKNGRGVQLSDDGERLIEFARRIVGLELTALQVVGRKALSGRVRFGIPDEYAGSFLADILRQFSNSHPLVEVTVVCDGSLQLSERVVERKIDVAVVSDCDAIADVEVVRHEQLHWVGSPQLALDAGLPVPLALSSPSCMWRQTAESALASVGTASRLILMSNNFSAIGPLVLAGLAITVLPSSALRPGMKELKLPELLPQLPQTRVGMIRAGGQITEEVSAFAQSVRASLSRPSNQSSTSGVKPPGMKHAPRR